MLDFLKNHWRDGIEILVLTICVYQMYRAFRNTRGAQILIGLGSILIVPVSYTHLTLPTILLV